MVSIYYVTYPFLSLNSSHTLPLLIHQPSCSLSLKAWRLICFDYVLLGSGLPWNVVAVPRVTPLKKTGFLSPTKHDPWDLVFTCPSSRWHLKSLFPVSPFSNEKSKQGAGETIQGIRYMLWEHETLNRSSKPI